VVKHKYLFHSLEFVKTDEISVFSILNGESLIVSIGSEGLEVEFNDQTLHKMSWDELESNAS
jgi:hypothetical protein